MVRNIYGKQDSMASHRGAFNRICREGNTADLFDAIRSKYLEINTATTAWAGGRNDCYDPIDFPTKDPSRAVHSVAAS